MSTFHPNPETPQTEHKYPGRYNYIIVAAGVVAVFFATSQLDKMRETESDAAATVTTESHTKAKNVYEIVLGLFH